MSQCFFQLVDPEDTRRDPLGDFQRAANAAFRFADETPEGRADVEADQWRLPGASDHFRRQRLSGSGNPDQRDPFRRGKSIRGGVGAEGFFTGGQPVLQDVESADGLHWFVRVGIFERFAFEQGFLLFFRDRGDIFVAQESGSGDRFGKRALRLSAGQPESGADEPFSPGFAEPERRSRLEPETVDFSVDFKRVGKLERNFDGLAAQLDRELVLDRRDQDRFPALPERLAQRPEPASDGRVIPERVEIFEEEERGPIGRGFIDRFERGERVAASVRRVFFRGAA